MLGQSSLQTAPRIEAARVRRVRASVARMIAAGIEMLAREHRRILLVLMLCAVVVALPPAALGDKTPCCPEDFSGDGVVDGGDLGQLLAAWGNTPGDLTGDGTTDGEDLGVLLAAWGPCPTTSCLVTEVVGTVQLANGTPVADAVIVTDQGGKGVSGSDGAFEFTLKLARKPPLLRVTAVATINGSTYTGSVLAQPVAIGGITDAGVIVVSSEGGVPSCEELGWIPTFGEQPGVNGVVRSLTVFDDGSGAGPALYAGGLFTTAGSQLVNRVARWDGASWSPLGSGMDGDVQCVTAFDDGSGAGIALYAGGSFNVAGGTPVNRIARWDGASWSPLGTGMGNGSVFALAVVDVGDGSGPRLYAGGTFTSAGGVAANRIARWDGASWSALGSGIDGSVVALTGFDDGSGARPALYAGGGFTTAGGASVNGIARWDGASWSALGSGISGGIVRALTAFDDGSDTGPALYAGGDFSTAGGVSVNRIARWDGTSWSPLGSGMSGPVRALTVFDDGSGDGPALYAGGDFSTAGDVSVNRIARWDDSSWSSLGSGMGDGSVAALTEFDDGSGRGPKLFAGGSFTTADGVAANRIARWDGTSWSPLGTGGMNDSVRVLTVFDDGSGGGPALYAGGFFTTAGGVSAIRIARWDGISWTPLGSGMSSVVEALTVFDDGGGAGPALYAGGNFITAGGVTVNRIARWDGVAWSPVGSGMNQDVNALIVFDDGGGAGPALFAGGNFTAAGGVAANRIARWNGISWSPLGSGVNQSVLTLEVFDDGRGGGPALYAGGVFTTAGGLTVNRIARWDGKAWSALGSGLNDVPRDLTVFDDGSGCGLALYAGGEFSTAGGVPVNRIARWDGASWSPLGSGTNTVVWDLLVFDDGDGPALYAGGNFTTAGGVLAQQIARWDGVTWSSLDSGMDIYVYALAVFNDGSGGGTALYAGGQFTVSAAGDSFLAKWGCDSPSPPPLPVRR